MVPILRAVAMYGFLLFVVRLSGKRTLAEVTVFDFILLLVISEATQQAMTGNDFSVTNGVILVTTLLMLDRLSDFISSRSERADRVLNDLPLLLVDDGEVMQDRLKWTQVQEHDIMESARKDHGLERFEQIRYAVLERSGGISIIPQPDSGS
jgi:uncharacterized membrane protein YcaP (DUF421 family)